MTKDLTQLAEVKDLKRNQRAFVIAYLTDPQTAFNATQSAIKANYAKPSANVTGSKLLTNPNIIRAIDAITDVLKQENKLTVEWIEQKIKEIAENSTKDDTKLRALELLGKILGAFKDNTTNIALFSNDAVKQLTSNFTDALERTNNPSAIDI